MGRIWVPVREGRIIKNYVRMTLGVLGMGRPSEDRRI